MRFAIHLLQAPLSESSMSGTLDKLVNPVEGAAVPALSTIGVHLVLVTRTAARGVGALVVVCLGLLATVSV